MEKGIKVVVATTDDTVYSRMCYPVLESMHEIVGGYIERVGPTKKGIRLPHGFVMVVNEEGHLRELPLNKIATAVYHHEPIVGNVMFVKEGYVGDGYDFMDCTALELADIIQLIYRIRDVCSRIEKEYGPIT